MTAGFLAISVVRLSVAARDRYAGHSVNMNRNVILILPRIAASAIVDAVAYIIPKHLESLVFAGHSRQPAIPERCIGEALRQCQCSPVQEFVSKCVDLPKFRSDAR